MKYFFRMIMSIIDPLWTTDLQWWWCEQLYIISLTEVNNSLNILYRVWKDPFDDVDWLFLFIVGTFKWFDKSYVTETSYFHSWFSIKCAHHDLWTFLFKRLHFSMFNISLNLSISEVSVLYLDLKYTKRSRAKSALSTNLTSYIREL